jgi:tRNA pseudouridine55 synthase
MLKANPDLEGILLVDKPQGCTSHDVVDRVRRKLGLRRVGHAGTLDPMATGLLIILVGRATKASAYLMSLDKVYEGRMLLGQTTDSQDADGALLNQSPVPALSAEALQAQMQLFVGDQYQTPPMFSAKKVAGKPLYKLARQGQTIDREPRFIHVGAFDLLQWDSPFASFRVQCSKGTYIRTLAHDLGQKIGCGAHLVGLRRTATHAFTLDQALPLSELEAMPLSALAQRLVPVYQAVPSSLVA